MNSMMEFRVIKDFTRYEINREGDVRIRGSQKPILTDRGGSRWASLLDAEGRSRQRSVIRLVEQAFSEEEIDHRRLRTTSDRMRDAKSGVEWRTIPGIPHLEINMRLEVRKISNRKPVRYQASQLRFTIDGERMSAPVRYLVREAFPEEF